MKKLFLVFSILICGLSVLAADEYTIINIECINATSFTKKEISLKYDDQENVYYLWRSDYASSYWFTLTPDQLKQLRTTLSKTQDWAKIAKENKSCISKELPNSALKVPGAERTGNSWY